jgi:uncharacterized membrane protein YiaA
MCKLISWFRSEYDKVSWFNDGQIRVFLWAFVGLTVVLSFIYGFGSVDAEHSLDFLAYAGPTLAATLAGSGLYIGREAAGETAQEGKRLEKNLYVFSVLLLFIGLFCYALGHSNCKSPSIYTICGFFLISGVIVLFMRICNSSVGGIRAVFNSIAFTVCLACALFMVVMTLFFYQDFFIGNGITFLCIDQARH